MKSSKTNVIIGNKPFTAPVSLGTLQKSGASKGVIILKATQAPVAAGASVNFQTFFTPQFQVRLKRITSMFKYQVAGAGVWARINHTVSIYNNVNFGVLYSTPGNFDNTGVSQYGLTTSRFFDIVNSTDLPYDCDLVLQPGTVYMFEMYSDFRAWGATDNVGVSLNIEWEKV